ncbi:MAG: hypothetical protein Q8906_02605 [Bacillota bacterium]|nr:hypothetical protein [Bacillota bacterium]MDP4169472.1 hypothetical protein [Bacillota bacterium]
MKLCELCGSKEETVMIEGQEQDEEVNLHICENCLHDRKYNPLNWLF